MEGEKKISFEEISDRQWERLTVYATKVTRKREAAEDLVQGVFLSFLQKFEGRQIDNVESYLLSALRYQCFNYLRNAKVSTTHLEHMKRAVGSSVTEEEMDLKFTTETISLIVSNMPPHLTETFEFSRFQHLPNEEIATRLSLSQRTVENRLSSAMRILRLSLKTTFMFFF